MGLRDKMGAGSETEVVGQMCQQSLAMVRASLFGKLWQLGKLHFKSFFFII